MALPNEIHPFAIAGGGNQYQVANSLRFRNSVSANLSKAAYGGYPMTATWSCWIKRGSGLGSTRMSLLASNDRGDYFDLFTFQADTLEFWHRYNNGDSFFYTNAVFRDPSAWYHIVLIMDPSQASNSNRVKIYVNGVSQTLTVSGTWTQNQNFRFFSPASSTTIGGVNAAPTMTYFDGYMAEMYFIEGAYDPSYFGQTDSITGQWVPKKYTGTYGTNGFYLPFNDSTSTTTLGYDRQLGLTDSSKNNWTLNNFSITSGSTYDVMIDSPTAYNDGGNNRGNYPTLNPLSYFSTAGTLTNGNMSVSYGNSSNHRPTLGARSGKWYAEITCTSAGGYSGTGLSISVNTTDTTSATPKVAAIYCNNGQVYNFGSASYVNYGATWTNNDIIGVAFDCDTGDIIFYKNGVSQGTLSSPSNSFSVSGNDVAPFPAAYNTAVTTSFIVNYGQRPFTYTPPAGYKALNSYNLANPSLPLV